MHISSELTQSLAPVSILQWVCDGIAEALGFQRVCADLLDDDGESLVTRALAGFPDGDPVVHKNLSLTEISTLFDGEFECAGCYLVPNEVARERLSASQVIYESSSNGRGPHAWNHHWLAIPLHGPAGETIGLIWADEPEDRLLPTEERLQALRVFANQAASALTLATQFEQMRYLADHDPLTQLPNRRAFMRELERSLDEADETGGPLALIIVDVDGLKAMNDRRGHAAGDECLIRIAELLRSELERDNAAFRIGGDEFAVLLPGCDYGAGTATSAQLVQSLQRQGQSSILRIEASFGVAERTAKRRTADLLLRAADEAMYRAKHERRSAAAAAG
jgi:diguanylate cyclase (GGDEF)-like protein